MRRHLLVCSFVALVLIALLSGAASATIHRFIESFDTKLYCDTLNTTALWDTVVGELRLPPCAFEIVGAWNTPGGATGVAIDGDIAYVADGTYGLQIFDITNLASPTLLGTYNTPGSAYEVFADGNHVYVADGSSGIAIINVTNPASPALTGSYNTSGTAYDVVVEGDYAYVADYTYGLVVLNVSNPASPTLAGSYDTPGYARRIAVAGNYAFVADYTSGLQVIDIANPASPTLAASYATVGLAHDVALSGDRAYIAVHTGGLEVIDITNPASPASVTSLTLAANAFGVGVSGDYAYVACSSAGLIEIDISNPSTPVVKRTLDTPDAAWDVAVDGDHAFIADYGSGLQIARIACPAPLLVEGWCSLWGAAQDVAIDGNYAYIADGGYGVQVVDISDPAAPVSVGEYTTTSYCTYIAVDGDYAIASATDSTVIVLDITDPTSPALLGTYDAPDVPYGVDIAGDHAFVAAEQAGLLILDISDPSTPTLLGTCNTLGTTYDVAVAGNYAFLADGGFRAVDISDPANPVIVGSCVAYAYSVTVAGDYAYVAYPGQYVSSIDISNPSSPVVASTTGLYSGGYGYDIAVAGNYAYVAAGSPYRSLQVIDITNPASIERIAWTPIAQARGVVCAGDYAFVAEGNELRTVRISVRDYLAAANVGRSLVVNSPSEQIVKARLSAAETGTIHWMLSADGGANWKSVPSDRTWQTLSYPGTDLLWRDDLSFADYPNNPTCSQVEIEWLYEPAIIDSIRDIPGDQGGQVRAYFTRSGRDFGDEETYPIATYNVWRRVDGAALASTKGVPLSAAADEKFGDLPVMSVGGRLMLASNPTLQAAGLPPGMWEVMGSFSATQLDQYVHPTLTLADSTVEDGMAYAVYMVTAHTTTPYVWYASAPDSGYSLDNLAPHVPTGLAVAYNSGSGNDLSWDACPDYDFEYFKVYRGTSEDFVPEAGNLAQTTIDTDWLDTVDDGYLYCYRVSAVDHAGNESAPASAGTVTDADPPAMPKTFALYQNVPNPFNPTTRIRFDLPEAADVRLVVYDVSGRKIRELASGQMPAGAREVTWDGRDAAGRAAASGIYFYRLDAGRFTQTRKMILLR